MPNGPTASSPSVEYQHQELHDFSINLPLTAPPTVDSLTLSARHNRPRQPLRPTLRSAAGFGLSATYAYMDPGEQGSVEPNYGGNLPYHSDRIPARSRSTWVNEAKVKATVAANYIGERDGEISAPSSTITGASTPT